MKANSIFLILLITTSGLFLSVSLAETSDEPNVFDQAFSSTPDFSEELDQQLLEQSMQSNVDQQQNVNSYNNPQDEIKDFSPEQTIQSEERSEAYETTSIAAETHSPGRDSYVVDFGFHQLFSLTATQVPYSGWLGYLSFTETAYFSVDLTIPVNLTMNYDPTVEAGNTANVIVDLYRDPAGASFSVSYGFLLGGEYKKGPWGSKTPFQLLNYTNTYVIAAFEVPLDPVPLREFAVPLPLDALLPGISALFAIDLLLTPQLDVDISADLFFDGLGSPNVDSITFKTEERQSFAIEIDSFSPSETGVLFGLTNFSMDFYLSLLWGLQVRFAGLLSFLNFFGPLKVKLFTYPRLPIGGLLTTGDATGSFNVMPTQNLPEFSLDSYDLTDGVNDILEPGDVASIGTDFINLGTGPVINANVTVSSQNITLTSGVTGQYLTPILRNGILTHNIAFDLSSGYTQRNANITYDIQWLAANGSIRNTVEILTISVLQAGDAHLKIDTWNIFDGDNSQWDADEAVRIDLDISKVGTGAIDFVYVEVYATSPGGYTSNQTWDSFSGAFSSWTSQSIYLTSPIDISNYEVDLYIWLSYDIVSGPTHDDFLILPIDVFPLTPEEDLAGIYGALNTGVDDDVFQAGESFDVTAELENLGNYDTGDIYGLLVTNDTDVFFDNAILHWSNQVPSSGPILSTNSLFMEISPHAENQTIEMTLYVSYYTWWGEEIIDQFPVTLEVVQQRNPILDLNYYNVLDIDTLSASTLSPGDDSLIIVNIDVTDGPAYSAIGTLTSDNEAILILNDTSFYGDLAIGNEVDGDGFVVYVPANFAGGDVTFTVNVTLYSATGQPIFKLGTFTITVAAGDTILPTFVLDAPIALKQGESGIITISADDDIEVDSIYFAYYSYALEDWEFVATTWTSTPTVMLNVTMGSTDFLYAFMIFDVSGNLAGGGLDVPLEIDLTVPTTTSTTSSTSTSTTSSQTTSTTTQPTSSPSSSEKSDGGSSPVSIIWIIGSLLVVNSIIAVFRRRGFGNK